MFRRHWSPVLLIMFSGALGSAPADDKPASNDALTRAFEIGERIGALKRSADLLDPVIEASGDAKRKESWALTRKELKAESESLKKSVTTSAFDAKRADESLKRFERELTVWEGYAALLSKDKDRASAFKGGFRDLPGLNGGVILHGDIVQLRAMELLEQMVKDPEGVKKTLQKLVDGAKPADGRPLGPRIQESLMKEVERIKKESEKKNAPKKP